MTDSSKSAHLPGSIFDSTPVRVWPDGTLWWLIDRHVLCLETGLPGAHPDDVAVAVAELAGRHRIPVAEIAP